MYTQYTYTSCTRATFDVKPFCTVNDRCTYLIVLKLFPLRFLTKPVALNTRVYTLPFSRDRFCAARVSVDKSKTQLGRARARVNRLTRRRVRSLSVGFECAEHLRAIRWNLSDYTAHISRPHLPAATCCCATSWLIPCLSTHTPLFL